MTVTLQLKATEQYPCLDLAWISSDYFESLLLPQLLRGENDSKQSDEIQASLDLVHTYLDIFESGIRIRNFLNPLSWVEICPDKCMIRIALW